MEELIMENKNQKKFSRPKNFLDILKQKYYITK